jgi:Protein of unknown function (DUF2726)
MDRRKRLVNSYEAVAKKILTGAAGRNNCSVYTKVRVADVLNMDRSGISDELYSYGFKAHFDFVVADQAEFPLFAVEYDGPSHLETAAMARDRKKNELCERLGLPLARVRDAHLFEQVRGYDYLTWLSEFYFAFQTLVRAQESGAFPLDEPPDPMFFLANPHLPGRFPFFVSSAARISLRKLYEQNLIGEPNPMVLRGYDSGKSGHSLLLLQLADGSILVEHSAIYLHGFGIASTEVAEEIAMVNADALVKVHLEKMTPALTAKSARRKVVEFLRSHECFSCASSRHAYGFSIGFRRADGISTWKVGSLGDEQEVIIGKA